MRKSFLEAHETFREGRFMPVVLDIETTIKDGSPDPKYGGEFVLGGIAYYHKGTIVYSNNNLLLTYLMDIKTVLDDSKDKVVLVGHNIKFDLKHLMHKYSQWVTDNILQHPNLLGIWDTGIHEYLDSGMAHKFPSLAYGLKRWGIEEAKGQAVVEAFKEGKGADTIDPDKLMEYLESDLRLTAKLFEAQKVSAGKSLMTHMFVQGWATVAYTKMENIGIPFDKEAMEELDEVTSHSVERIETVLQRWIFEQCKGVVPLEDCDPTNRNLSSVLFGIPGIPFKRKTLVGKYKNGKPKFKSGMGRATPDEHLDPTRFFDEPDKYNPHLGYSVADGVLDKIIAWPPLGEDHEYVKICALIKAWRAKSKIVNTYTAPLLDRMDGNKSSRVYHTINNVRTGTGRTSSSNPNGQNMPDEIRKLVSVKEGKIVQFDFSQLEMVAAAQLSHDPQFLLDVATSDVHYETGKEVMGWKTREDMDKHSRRKVKGINFGIIYGGGYKTLSQQTGVPENLVKRQINAFKRRYPVFAEWQKNLKETVNATPGCSPVFRDGEAYYLHPWVSVTGRTYMFRDKKRKWDGKIGPNPSEIVNYPVQGFATGDIVPLLLAYAHGYYNMVNMYPFLAVHDSCVAVKMDGRAELLVEEEIDLMETYLPNLIKEVYGVTMQAPLKLDVEIKDTWT